MLVHGGGAIECGRGFTVLCACLLATVGLAAAVQAEPLTPRGFTLRHPSISDTLDRKEDDAMHRASTLLLAGLLIAGSGAVTTGCSSTTTTHTVERPAASSEEGATQTETTTTETHETSGPGVGIVSGTVHVIGMILALPFKIIGGLIELIF